MTPQEIKKLKSALLKEKEILEAELSRFAAKDPFIKGNYRAHFRKPEPDDTSDEKAHSITDYEEERAIEQSLELRLREINDAFERVERGAYGICDKCQTPIEEKRLKVIPIAKFCLSCANKTKQT
jgi:DnaK suppressor protein